MSYGIQVRSDVGFIIDGELPNFALFGTVNAPRVHGPAMPVSGTSLDSKIPVFTHKSLPINLPANARPLITFQPAVQTLASFDDILFNSGIALEALTFENGAWYAYLICGPNVGTVSLTVHARVDALSVGGDAYGMQAFSPSGDLVFNSQRPPVKFIGFAQVDVPGIVFTGFSYDTAVPVTLANRLTISANCRAAQAVQGAFITQTVQYSPMCIRTANFYFFGFFASGSTGYSTYTQAANAMAQFGPGIQYSPDPVKRFATFYMV